MPTSLHEFTLKRAVDGLMRALKDISQENGYENTPIVQLGHRPLDKIADGEFPFLAVEMGDLAPSTEQLGGHSQGLVRWAWPAFVWGFVRTSGNRAELYDAGMSLLVDVFGAIWYEEGLKDGNGQAAVHFVNPGEITFDMESKATDNLGYFLAEFQLVTDIQRGASP